MAIIRLQSSQLFLRLTASNLRSNLYSAFARSSKLNSTFFFSTTTAMASEDQIKDSKILKWASKDGEFRRKDVSVKKPVLFLLQSQGKSTISKDPNATFSAEKGRYHLYISYACPWAHRTAIVRELKGLQDIIGLSIVDWYLGEKGWKFSDPSETPGATIDPINGAKYLSELYFKADADYDGRYTVPVLWDKKLNTIVNNESSEIIRIFNTAFDDLVEPKYKHVTYYPQDLQKKIDELNEWVYDTVNNGVYKAGFASKQEVYENHVVKVFSSLDRLEKIFAENKTGPYLLGDVLTEADIRLYTTIIRFDTVYVQHFKCNISTIRSNYPAIHKWLKHLYWDIPEFKDTTNFEHIKKHYTKSHKQINPFSITPLGPVPDIEPK
ncbi:glutathione S-transferase [Lipomyces japonicus]|uniref:glutathione S-transferase n=1 Tax=Lipomyces japonicus TaxID=56871 RepID=UPI0034CF8074